MADISKPTAIACLLAGGLALTLAAAAEGNAPPKSEPSAKSLLSQWVETQQIIAKERKDWQQGREVLRSRIELLKSEIGDLEKQLGQLQSAAAESSGKRHEIVSEDSSLKEASATLGRWVAELEEGVRSLYPRLPEPVQARVRPLYDRIPADAAATQVSNAERYQNVIGILNEVGKANGEITLTTEVRTLSDGKPSEVKVVYVGLGQAYFLSAKGEAGIGRPSDKGWTWENAPSIGPQVLEVIQVLQNKATPKFIPLPVKVL